MENELTISKCLILLKAAYPKMEFNQQSVAVYQLALSDIDPQLLQAAVLKHISVAKWFPTIAELRQGVTELILEAEGQLTAPEAWGVVIKEVRRVGHWGQPDLAPLVLQAVQATGGWQALCFSENSAADRARFLEAYGLLRKRKAQEIQQMPTVREARAELASGRSQIDSAVKQVAARLNNRATDGESLFDEQDADTPSSPTIGRRGSRQSR